MFKALYSHVNNIIDKYLQIYNHILIYLQWIKKEKLKLKQLLGNWSKLYYMLGTHHNKSRLLSLPIAPSPFPDIHGIFHSPPPLLLTVAPLSSWGDPWYLL